MKKNPIDVEFHRKNIDRLITRGLRRLKKEKSAVTIADYIRLLQLCPEMNAERESPLEIVWIDDMESYKPPEAA